MERLILIRQETGDQGTFGQIETPEFLLFTGELPWRDNASNASCIPDGLYKCRWTFSQKFRRKMYSVEPVNNRSGIRIHSANLMGDKSRGFTAQLNGCIALGEKFGWIGKQKAILSSTTAVRKLEQYFNGRTFELEIKWG